MKYGTTNMLWFLNCKGVIMSLQLFVCSRVLFERMGGWFNYNIDRFESILDSLEGLTFRYDAEEENVLYIDATDQNKELMTRFIEELRQDGDSIYEFSIPLSERALKEDWCYTNDYVANVFESILQNYDKSADRITLVWF
jgi:hypothetical protein